MPENVRAVLEVFSVYSIRVRLTPDVDFRPGEPIDFSPDAAFSTVRWRPIMYSLMWVLAHGAWEAMRYYGSAVLVAYTSGVRSVSPMEIGRAASQRVDHDKAIEAIDCAIRLARGENAPLPEWLPNIDAASNVEQAAVRELWFVAIVWMLLHETQHIVFRESSTTPADVIQEELACDHAACDWLFSNVDAFGADPDSVPLARAKRAMGALVAMFCIAWLSKGRLSSTHPDVVSRLTLLLDSVGEHDAGRFWEFAVGLIFVLARDREMIEFPTSGKIRDLVLTLVALINA
jgi:hypothetical protein